jgi:hypothetical protein
MRRDALYITFTCIYLIFSTISLTLSSLFSIFYNFILTNIFFMFGVINILLSIIAVFIRFRAFKPYSIIYSKFKNNFKKYENATFKLSMFFPPLLPPLRLDHLMRHEYIDKIIINDEEIISFLVKSWFFEELDKNGVSFKARLG